MNATPNRITAHHLDQAATHTTPDALTTLLHATGITDPSVQYLTPLAELQALKLVQAILNNPHHPEAIETILAQHPTDSIRVLTARTTTRPHILHALSADPTPTVRAAVAENPATPLTALKTLIEWDEWGTTRLAAAKNITLRHLAAAPATERLLDRLHNDPRAFVRYAAAWGFNEANQEQWERQHRHLEDSADAADTMTELLDTSEALNNFTTTFSDILNFNHDDDTLSEEEHAERTRFWEWLETFRSELDHEDDLIEPLPESTPVPTDAWNPDEDPWSEYDTEALPASTQAPTSSHNLFQE
ncbi:HEAT repeat domain-containing protein [Leucobacter salsicius]|uniref:HEAT repeat domain-containing protein n=1 Tax=Leucobacter salsicius TaxID=664638 RepID=UPI0003490282|nr:HEAT repeat domain-containing protein [Leucobacter salsicius]